MSKLIGPFPQEIWDKLLDIKRSLKVLKEKDTEMEGRLKLAIHSENILFRTIVNLYAA